MKFQYPFTIMISMIILLLATTSNSQNVPPPPGSCGPASGGLTCDVGWCCSNWGFCGNTSAYCSQENCQSQCWAPPSPPPPPPSPPPPPPPSPPPPSPPPPPPPSPPPPPPSPPPPLQFLCGIDYGFQACPDEDMCCTVQGRCAYKGSSWCDAGDCQNNCNAPPNCGINAGFRQCPQDQCCSMAGLCAIPSSAACRSHCVSQCPRNQPNFKKEIIGFLDRVI